MSIRSLTSSKKVNKPKLIRVLLDSGSDRDLMFQRKGTSKCFPYSARLVPKHGARRMGLSTQREKASWNFSSLNKVTVRQ
jgi:hypothetical protein